MGYPVTTSTKIVISAWIVVVLLLIIAAVSLPVPVQKVNKSCCSANECAAQHHHEKAAEILTNEHLYAWYAGFNESYFFNRLPKNVDIHWASLPKAMGETVKHDDGSWTITIDRETNLTRGEVVLTIAHETCHIATWGSEFDSHGPKFQNCMVNLAAHGAFEGLW